MLLSALQKAAEAPAELDRQPSPMLHMYAMFAHEKGEQIKWFKKGFEGACRRAVIDYFTPHDMRHTVASWLVQNEVPIRQVCELLRHSSITVTMRYAHLAPSNVMDAVNLLSSHFSHT